MWDDIWEYYRVIKRDTRSLDYSSPEIERKPVSLDFNASCRCLILAAKDNIVPK